MSDTKTENPSGPIDRLIRMLRSATNVGPPQEMYLEACFTEADLAEWLRHLEGQAAGANLPKLVTALKWYLAHDDTIECEDNQFWLDGRRQAEDALREVGEL